MIGPLEGGEPFVAGRRRRPLGRAASVLASSVVGQDHCVQGPSISPHRRAAGNSGEDGKPDAGPHCRLREGVGQHRGGQASGPAHPRPRVDHPAGSTATVTASGSATRELRGILSKVPLQNPTPVSVVRSRCRSSGLLESRILCPRRTMPQLRTRVRRLPGWFSTPGKFGLLPGGAVA